MDTHETTEVQVQPADKKKIRLLVRVAVILFVVTVLEFAIAFTMPYTMQTLKVAIFIGMTIVKAAYIVGEFMHLRYEVKSLMWSIVLPMVFVMWLIVALVYEGDTMVIP